MTACLKFDASDGRWSCDVLLPLSLSEVENQTWHAIIDGNANYHRAFYAPEFAQACERAHGRARVLVLRYDSEPAAFFPFQFSGKWSQLTRSAQRIGGELSDYAGVVAKQGFEITNDELLEAAGLSELFLNHLPEYQSDIGLRTTNPQIGHVIELPDGGEHFLDALAKSMKKKKNVVQDTRRCFRKAERELGALEFQFNLSPNGGDVEEAIAFKRMQYERTGVIDVFSNAENGRIISAILDNPSPHCRLMTSKLDAGDQTMAWHFGLVSNGVLIYWFPAYDPELGKLSPGRLLLWRMIEAAEENAIHAIDMGLGDTQYKREFSNCVKQFGEINPYGRNASAFTVRAVRSLGWRLRSLSRKFD